MRNVVRCHVPPSILAPEKVAGPIRRVGEEGPDQPVARRDAAFSSSGTGRGRAPPRAAHAQRRHGSDEGSSRVLPARAAACLGHDLVAQLELPAAPAGGSIAPALDADGVVKSGSSQRSQVGVGIDAAPSDARAGRDRRRSRLPAAGRGVEGGESRGEGGHPVEAHGAEREPERARLPAEGEREGRPLQAAATASGAGPSSATADQHDVDHRVGTIFAVGEQGFELRRRQRVPPRRPARLAVRGGAWTV